VFICDECVDVCVAIISDDAQRDQSAEPSAVRPATARAYSASQPWSVCALCGTPGASREMLPIRNRGDLCGACADAVEDALAQGRPAS
jgi:hypothetical protein